MPNIASRLGISKINEMQRAMLETAATPGDTILLAPTGSGKTLAFILPLLKLMRETSGRIQAIILAPTRELVMQIADVTRKIAPTYRIAAFYGGHNMQDEINTLTHTPDIVVATPGRLLDHSRRATLELLPIRLLVLDEFDKSLELGFEKEMTALIKLMKNISRIILTSATDLSPLPTFLPVHNPRRISYLTENKELKQRIRVHRVDADVRDKLMTLSRLLQTLMPRGNERTIIFVNHRESAERVAESLRKIGVNAGLYHGALEQIDRQKALALFNNGTRPVLVATDLASRGIDIPEVKNIIHYHQPLTEETYTHRNGRTARVNQQGDIYVIIGPDEDIKPYIEFHDTTYTAYTGTTIPPSGITTLYISAGKREKVSRADILGYLVKTGGIPAAAVGKIDIYDHYSLTAIASSALMTALPHLKDTKLKRVKRRISPVL